MVLNLTFADALIHKIIHFALLSGICFSFEHPRNDAAGVVKWVPQLCHHHHREALRDPLLHLRHHRLHVRDRERHHCHIRLLPRIQEAHPNLHRCW